ncbi:META domain-containing protein [Kineosporia succinea]|uniref:Heat shock protein HslJ n=1 Tax=Kineosporia succinea TaxID=84632 RepID=A0ABT9PEZ1_9ACTN|nr:META domain-containing protein [Kineosporia succinea]MDP9831061.1 heat shock protein HslJ [Kineosporia succinea]
MRETWTSTEVRAGRQTLAWRRAVTRTWPAAGLLLVLAACGAEDSGGTVTPRDAEPALQQEILGTWYPQKITGYEVPKGPLGESYGNAVVTFKDDGTWVGSDGCNGLGGHYQVGEAGTFHAPAEGGTTRIGCANVPNGEVLGTATTASVKDGVLTLSTEGKATGRYVRTPPAPSAS